MQAATHLSVKLPILFTLVILIQSSFAQELPNLPEAFDAGWKGEKTCELLYETESVRVGRCIFPPGIGHEKHFLVTELEMDENGVLIHCLIEAIMTRRSFAIDWQELRNSDKWAYGWV